MGGQVVARIVSGREHLDLELLVQCPRLELRCRETAGDPVIDLVSGLLAGSFRDPEDLAQLSVQSEPHRRAAISTPVRAQDPERLA